MSQLDYDDPKALVAGMITPGGVTEIQSRVSESVLEFGTFVIRGADLESGAKVPTVATEEIIGIIAFNQNISGNIAVGDDISLVTKGSVACTVVTADTPVAGGVAYVVAAGADAGKLTTTITSNFDLGLVFGSAKKNDNLATVRIDLAK